MSVITLVGPVTDDFSEVNANNASTVVSAAYSPSGRAYRCAPVTTATQHVAIRAPGADGVSTNFNVATAWGRFGINVTTLPASAEAIAIFTDSTGATKFAVRIASTGKLQAYDSAGAQLGSDSTTVLSLTTPYMIMAKAGTAAGSAGAWQISIYNFVLSGGQWDFSHIETMSGTGTLLNNNNARFNVGKSTNINGTGYDINFFNIIVADTEDPGPWLAARADPTANGSTMAWTAGTGATFAEVDEGLTPNDADYVQSTGSAGDVALFTTVSCTTAGVPTNVISDPFSLQSKDEVRIKAVVAIARTRENTAVTSACLVRIKSGGSNADSSTLNGSTTVSGRVKIALTDPATSAAWTRAAVDAAEVGAVENNAVATRLTYVAKVIWYLPKPYEISKTISADSGGARDYNGATAISTWKAALEAANGADGNLVAVNQKWVCTAYDDGAAFDEADLQFVQLGSTSGNTPIKLRTDTACTIILKAAAGREFRMGNHGTDYVRILCTQTPSTDAIVFLRVSNMLFEGFGIGFNGTPGAVPGRKGNHCGGGDAPFITNTFRRNCGVFIPNGGPGYFADRTRGFSCNDNYTYGAIQNCWVQEGPNGERLTHPGSYLEGTRDCHGILLAASTSGGVGSAWNCSVYGVDGEGISLEAAVGAAIDATNCIVIGSARTDYKLLVGGGTETVANSRAGDTSGTQDNAVATDIWVSPATGNLHLKAASAAIGAGTDLSGTPYYCSPFDCDQEDRTGLTWDQGADQYVVGSAMRRLSLSAGARPIEIGHSSVRIA